MTPPDKQKQLGAPSSERGRRKFSLRTSFSRAPRSPFRAAVSVLFFSACVPVPPGMLPQAPGSQPATSNAFPDIDPGGTTLTSLHFALRGYGEQDMRQISLTAEDIYNHVGMETGLYSYLAGQTYPIVVYRDQAEYTTKTKEPNGSRAIAAGNTLYTYAGPEYDTALAHQISHLIFASYMGERGKALAWLNEGLAMHAEVARMSDINRTSFQTAQANKLRNERQPFSQMTFYNPPTEENRRSDAWFLQVESVVSFLLKQGTSLTFAAFLNELRNGADFERALTDNYGGKFRSVSEFERSWQGSL